MTVEPRVRPLERIVRRSLLGVRLIDVHTERDLAAGFTVTLRPDGDGGRLVRPVVGPSGIFSFHDLPGMRAHENPDLGLPVGSPGTALFALEVRDRAGRHPPVARLLTLPSADPLLELEVFGGPGYLPPAGWAVVRGRLVDGAAPEGDAGPPPAAHALIEVLHDDDPVGIGLSDERGEFAVPLPRPELPMPPLDLSPPVAPALDRLEDQSWELELRVRYSPGTLEWVRPADGVARGEELPEQGSVLAQPAADLVERFAADGTAVVAPALAVTLQYGREARAATQGRDALWIRPVLTSP